MHDVDKTMGLLIPLADWGITDNYYVSVVCTCVYIFFLYVLSNAIKTVKLEKHNNGLIIVLLQLRNKYLHMVMANLDSEVKELSSSTVDTMKQCMAKVNALKYKTSLYCTGYMGWSVFIYIDYTKLYGAL